MGVIFTEGIFILNYSPSAKRIRIPKPTFLPTCCSSAAAPMLPCPRMNRRPPRRNRSSCGGRMHVLTLTERAKTLCYLAIPRSCNRARESTRPQSRRLSIFNYIFIVLMYVIYIYIYSIIFYFFNSVPVYNRKAGPAHRSARALREGAPRGGRVSPP